MVSQIVVTLRDPDRAPALSMHFERLFGHRARSWQEREQGNLQVFSTLRISAAITVSLIIMLAGALIFNTLTMTVLDKVREIAILRSMGYRRWDITIIFLFQGFIVATLGSLLGAGFGALLTYGISQNPDQGAWRVVRGPFHRGLGRAPLHLRGDASLSWPC